MVASYGVLIIVMCVGLYPYEQDILPQIAYLRSPDQVYDRE